MAQKFVAWRAKNNYAGIISIFEVAHFTQDVILETKETLENNGT